ncbi:MAG: preprotein translocase subunit SecY [Candidatus Aenigmarchaeota archaeon]|nr:preprotein translocase subunit SecY [Candidatus Aenigmarchaeota archaeon]
MFGGEGYVGFLKRLPGVAGPIQRMTFRQKLKWTGIILLLYFMLAQIPAYGIAKANFENLRFLEILLGSSFGSIMTLGIGPIVTASIILQLLVGSKIIGWDLRSERGKVLFQGTQKLLSIAFSFLEAGIYVMLGAVPAEPGLALFVIIQLAIGGVLVIFMDELVSKWGFGSGVSLFIVAGVAKTIIVRAFNPLTQAGTFPSAGNPPAGIIPFAITSLAAGEPLQAFLVFLPVIATAIVFFIVIYANAIKVEIPLAFGSIRGFGRRWPLKFFYTSNIPVILTAALLANVQLMGRSLSSTAPWIAQFDSQGQVTGGVLFFLTVPRSEALAGYMITIGAFALLGILLAYFAKRRPLTITAIFSVLGGITWFAFAASFGLTALTTIPLIDFARMLTYLAFLVIGAVIFSIFWVTTAGMDARSVSEQIHSTGMQIPGYRRDVRIIESVLGKYIMPLAVLGAMAVGALAAYADFTNALGTGTGILLATLIIYNMYEDIAAKHMEDMHPAIRKIIGKEA